ncbi:hypothetical protein Ptr902_01278 [Pyrenophora tritici-repentis]|nr:hypothetical protein Ptr902_01278 [Pyrenophora tritici-repentis]
MAASKSSLDRPLTPKNASASAEPADADAKKDLSVLNPVPNHKCVTGFKLYIIVAAVAFVGFLMLLDNMIVSTAIPRITDEFHSLADVGWYASAYQFGSSVPRPLTGRIYKYFNTKSTFLDLFWDLSSVAYSHPTQHGAGLALLQCSA